MLIFLPFCFYKYFLCYNYIKHKKQEISFEKNRQRYPRRALKTNDYA